MIGQYLKMNVSIDARVSIAEHSFDQTGLSKVTYKTPHCLLLYNKELTVLWKLDCSLCIFILNMLQ